MSRAIEAVDGVTRVEISYELKEADVQSTDCTEDTYRKINEALAADGYGGTVTEARAITTP